MIRNSAEFIQPSSRTPSCTLNPLLERHIKRGAINACLPARYDLESFHCSGDP
jgi:hypothetical protein